MNKFKLIVILLIQSSFFAMAQGMSETPNQMLLRAVRVGDVAEKTIKKALDAGADVNVVDKNGDTPIMLLAMHGRLYGNDKALEILLKYGANEKVLDSSGRNLIQIAEIAGNNEFIKQLPIQLIKFGSGRSNQFNKIIEKQITLPSELCPIIGDYGFEEQVFEPGYKEKFEREKRSLSKENEDIMMADFIALIQKQAGVLK